MFFLVVLFLGYFFNGVPFLLLGGVGISLLLSNLGSKVVLGDNNHLFLSEHKAYECGFEHGAGGSGFSLQFYIVGLSFLLFDLEICLFTPLVGALGLGGFSGKGGVGFLILVLFLLIYEYLSGALDW
uniref:NADH-ubiquinone oxidoreductase chain 3 n=1 Tax=Botrylloides violaceus TaxID=581057 RepID=A0A024GW75_BOTVI|nr:NADH dehydrogenase subunit 3 [Botrylloides violaceus]CCO25701.1 NADH dehydrogenase subunit 3 [Botrylloides violaceus]